VRRSGIQSQSRVQRPDIFLIGFTVHRKIMRAPETLKYGGCKEPRAGTVSIFKNFPPKQHFHELTRWDAKIEKWKRNFKRKWARSWCVPVGVSDLLNYTKKHTGYHKISWDYPFKRKILDPFILPIWSNNGCGSGWQIWSTEYRTGIA
jgi:hypothetical protein